jgi:tripartite-type tricarboxylate transporter receptor subunit TctC
VIENRSGGGGSIGADAVARSAPDGYTLGLSNVSTHAVNPACNPRLPYDPIKNFTPLITLGTSANVIAVNPSLPAKTFRELVDLLKAAPGKYSYATSGTCGVAHLLGEQIKALTGTHMVHIPYRGAAPALNDVIAGQVPIMVDNLVSALPSIRAGKLQPLVVAWPQRTEALPDTPTLAEVGLAAANDPGWLGLVAPAGLPADIAHKLNQATQKVLSSPEVTQQFRQLGVSVAGGSAEKHGQLIASEFQKMRELVKRQRIQLQD